MITIVATTIVKPGCREKFLAALLEMVPKVRAEEGCVFYNAHIDHKADFSEKVFDENRVTIIEAWQDSDALHSHWNAPHMHTYRAATKDLFAAKSISFLDRVEP